MSTKKHGSCCLSKFSPKEYFDLAIRLRKKYDLLGILKAAGILPGGKYKTANIIKALRTGTKWTPDIQCKRDSKGDDLLFQIYLCVQADGKEFQHCKGAERSCSSSTKEAKFVSAESMTESLFEKENAATELEHEDAGSSIFEL
ncbi:hypothetical protein L1049_016437 [Liquidambar formosana]|uniref:Uncharacterized protein n=1 Tax=Liquidambar formosana TaxID=63359 RepID=A0AAP0X3E2_LIQFO